MNNLIAARISKFLLARSDGEVEQDDAVVGIRTAYHLILMHVDPRVYKDVVYFHTAQNRWEWYQSWC